MLLSLNERLGRSRLVHLSLAAIALFSIPDCVVGQTWRVSTFAGNGVGTFAGDGHPASTASLNLPTKAFPDTFGSVFIADFRNHRIRKVDINGVITTIAGNGTPGFSGDSGPASSALLNEPVDVLADTQGNLYIADRSNCRIRKIDTVGTISTIAGTSQCVHAGDGGNAKDASFIYPAELALDHTGNLYVTDSFAYRIRKIDMQSGLISTFAGNGLPGSSGDFGPATAASLYGPGPITFDNADNLLIVDSYNHRIRRVDRDGIITTIAGTGTQGFSGDGAAATAAELAFPGGVACGADGVVYLVDRINQRIRMIGLDGKISTIAGSGVEGYAGDGLPALQAAFANPTSISIDTKRNLYVADHNNHVIRLIQPPDSTPPVITPLMSGTQGANGWFTSAVTVSWQVTDPESGIGPTYGCTPSSLNQNTAGTTVTCQATNGAGLSSVASVTLKIDLAKPVIQGMPGGNCSIWPPNHKMVQVATVTASDAGSGLPASGLSLNGTSNEPQNPSDPDVLISPDGHGGFIVKLRADRLGTGSGRIYSLVATATDVAGNVSAVTTSCSVPHDQGH